MESALIVSSSEKSVTFFEEMLRSVSCTNISIVTNGGEARRRLFGYDFDVCIINAPLPDESGEALSRNVAERGMTQVILVVGHEFYEEVSDAVEEYGVITLAKPMSKNFLWSALKMAKATQSRLRSMRSEVGRLTQKMEDIRIIDRAKCILISYLNMSEKEAHKYMEKQAMDMRLTKRAVAEGILKTYEK